MLSERKKIEAAQGTKRRERESEFTSSLESVSQRLAEIERLTTAGTDHDSASVDRLRADLAALTRRFNDISAETLDLARPLSSRLDRLDETVRAGWTWKTRSRQSRGPWATGISFAWP